MKSTEPSSPTAVLCLPGATASGKTALAMQLIERYPLEIVSVDSALVYRRMAIGTAKPTAAELARAPHALIDLIEPWQHYSVSRFLDDVAGEIKRIASDGLVPLLVGGTMLYFNALWNGLSALPESDPVVRRALQEEAESNGTQSLHQRLARVDPEAAERIHPNDPQRLLRALEVYQIAGVAMTRLQRESRRHASDLNCLTVAIFPSDRTVLHRRIAQRFERMLKDGFEQEVATLMALPQMHPNLPSMRCVGYRQMWSYLRGETDRSQMIDRGVAATRQLAKRQCTWMRRMEHTRFIDLAQPSEPLPESLRALLDNWAPLVRADC